MEKPDPDPRTQSPLEPPEHHLPVLLQPDPMLDVPGGTLPTILMSLAAFAVVVLVLFGITRPQAPEQLASAPSASVPAQPPSGSAQAQKPEPSTTGQGSDQQARPEKS